MVEGVVLLLLVLTLAALVVRDRRRATEAATYPPETPAPEDDLIDDFVLHDLVTEEDAYDVG